MIPARHLLCANNWKRKIDSVSSVGLKVINHWATARFVCIWKMKLIFCFEIWTLENMYNDHYRSPEQRSDWRKAFHHFRVCLWFFSLNRFFRFTFFALQFYTFTQQQNSQTNSKSKSVFFPLWDWFEFRLENHWNGIL